jgi:hypothetical protein
MEDSPSTDAVQTNEAHSLEARINRLESAVVVFLAGASGLCILIGLFAPYASETRGRKRTDYFLASYGFESLAYRDSDGDVEVEAILFGLCFVFLLAVALAAVVLLCVIAARRAAPRTVRWSRTVAVLAIVVALGAWATLGLGTGNNDFDAGPGAVWFTAGVAGFSLLALTPAVGWWRAQR